MLRALTFVLLGCSLIVAPVGAAPNEPIVNYERRSVAGRAVTSADVRKAIGTAAQSLGWNVVDAGEGRLIATRAGRGRQRADVDIQYSAESYSLLYRRSVALGYLSAEQRIDPLYNSWMRNLVTHIDGELALVPLASAVKPAATTPLASGRDALTSIPAAVAVGERRHALVIGNASYAKAPLRNPLNDARAIAKVLAEVGFTVQLVQDATQAGMQRALRSFGDDIQKGGVGLFYYAGHGVQAKGRNFLVPVNADVDREYEAEFNSVDVNLVLSLMDAAKNSLNIVILDACRTNPFARGFAAPAAGLAAIDAPAGTFIAFATAPGAIASDGTGANGVYTKHLLEQIGRPGVPIEQLFKQVRIGVMRDTNDAQTPWESSSLRGDFAFVPGAASEPPAEIALLVAETLRRERENLIQAALERQRKQLEAQGLLPVAAAGSQQSEAAPPPSLTANAAPAVSVEATNSHLPQAADRWVYRLKPLRSQGERRYVAEVIAASRSGVLDRVSIDGGEWSEWVHASGGYLVLQGLSLFSPYLPQFEELKPGEPLTDIVLRDQAACNGAYTCVAKGRVVGHETLLTAAGAFDTIKAVVQQEWHPVQPGALFSADLWGSRTITVWYAPQVKRAVKYSSRVTAGAAPMEANFDLELLTYHLTGG